MSQKTIEVLIDKLQLTPIQAVWCMTLSEKHAIWIGNQVKANPDIYPKEAGSIKKILAWKKQNTGLDINEYDFKKALTSATEISKTDFKKDKGSLKNKNIVAVCDGTEYKWVELKTAEDVEEEGRYQRNCLRRSGMNFISNGSRVFSLRTDYNKPVVTMLLRNEEIADYRARFNGSVPIEYNHLLKFLEENGKIKISNFSKFHWKIITTLPSLEKVVEGNLVVSMKVDLPEGFCVNGNLEIRNNEIPNLPKGLVVKGNLRLSAIGMNAGVTLPSDMQVEGDIEVFNCQVVLPNNLKVNKNLYISSQSVKVPLGLSVGGNLIVSRVSGTIPTGTEIKGDLVIGRYMNQTPTPTNLNIKNIKLGGDVILSNAV